MTVNAGGRRDVPAVDGAGASAGDARFFETGAAFGEWLEANHATAPELWVGFRKVGSGRPSLTWPESVDEALSFGWIDGVRKRLDDESYVIRFTPRRPNSIWSAVNTRRVGELAALGRMHPAGLRAFEARSAARSGVYSFEREAATLPDGYLERLRADEAGWAYWQAQPAGYRKVATHWVTSAKRDETRLRRFDTLLADCAAGRRIAVYTLRPREPAAGD